MSPIQTRQPPAIATALVIIFIIVFFAAGMSKLTPLLAPAKPVAVVNFASRFCDQRTPIDYSNKDISELKIVLHPGCFDGPYRTPNTWATYFVQKSTQQGDWAALWCAGRPMSGRPHPYYEDFGNDLKGCYVEGEHTSEFYFQGQGFVLIKETGRRAGIPKKDDDSEKTDDPGMAAAAPAKPPIIMNPKLPEEGEQSDLRITVDACEHVSGRITIKCYGTVTNKTDMSERLSFRDSSAVDDKGNTLALSGFYGQVRFSQKTAQDLMPGVPTRFFIGIDDRHQGVTAVNLQIVMSWQNGYPRFTFKNIKVSQ